MAKQEFFIIHTRRSNGLLATAVKSAQAQSILTRETREPVIAVKRELMLKAMSAGLL